MQPQETSIPPKFGATDEGSLAPAVGDNSNGQQVAPGNLRAIGTPTAALDSDLIEKEWVEAAKSIMHQYKGDPYNQSKAMTILREDYLKKRYGKDIRASK